MCAVAIHGVDIEVSGIGLRREAVIPDIDPGTLNPNTLDVERVEKVGVLGQGSGILGLGGAYNISHRDVLCLEGSATLLLVAISQALTRHEESRPARRVLKMNSADIQSGGIGIDITHCQDTAPCWVYKYYVFLFTVPIDSGVRHRPFELNR